MSYPRVLQPLIIEDDPGAADLYGAVFEPFVEQGILAPPRHAYCYDDAVAELTSRTIFHLVILDLCLPECPGLPAPDQIDFGLALLEKCAARDDYPIPAVLVISGNIGKARQSELVERVREGFAHGKLLVKGPEFPEVLRKTIPAIISYCTAGIHVRDAVAETYPTLSPREDDLLRRCILNQSGCTGVDVSWWSAEYAPPSKTPAEFAGWTKTMMGWFLLEGGDSATRPNFFKFSPAANKDVVLKSARMMEHKLSHIKVRSSVHSDTRWLLVTEKVGSSGEAPISLSTFLGLESETIKASIPNVVRDIAEQVLSLGVATTKVVPLSQLLWKDHKRSTVLNQWRQFGGHSFLEHFSLNVDPLELFDRIQTSEMKIRVQHLSFLHGDLNITNVALDRATDGFHAFIFDSEGNCQGLSITDFAMLEVTALLHQSGEFRESLVAQCAHLYAPNVRAEPEARGESELNRVTNTIRFVEALRKEAANRVDLSVYAIAVFDQALLQLGGLAYTVSRNKIRSPQDAALLAALAAEWVSGMLTDVVQPTSGFTAVPAQTEWQSPAPPTSQADD